MDIDKHTVLEDCIIITDRKKKDEMIALLAKSGARIVKTIYGKGSVKASTLKDIFGFVPEENKIILMCLLPSSKAEALIETLDNEFNFDMPNTGIAFTIPVEGLSF